MKRDKPKPPKGGVDTEIESISATVSKVVGALESKLHEIEDEQSIIKNHYSNLENRLSFLEKKILKK